MTKKKKQRNPDISDAVQLAMHSAGMSPDQASALTRNATEIAQMQAEAEFNRRRNMLEGLDVQVRMDYRPENDVVCVETSVRADLRHSVMIDPRDLENPRILEETARRITPEFVRQFEAVVMSGMMEAVVRSRMMEVVLMMMRERYDRSPASEWARHAADMVTGFFGSSEAAKIDGPIAWLADFPHKTFKRDGWTAHVLDTADLIRAEGETMSHCLGKSYIVRISVGEYIAYHITAPEGQGYPKSGFTLGFHRHPDGSFSFDQLKGKKNSTHYNTDAKLLAVVDLITRTLCVKEEVKRRSGMQYIRELFA